MTRFEVLVEGASDVPAVKEILSRKFGLVPNEHFRIHPHRGRGNLPNNPLARPDPKQQTLLHQLPAKLQGFSHWGDDVCVLVVVDTDDNPADELLNDLTAMLESLPKRPRRVLFRLATEETESWFIADADAVRAAFPNAKLQKIRTITPDSIVGAWERLAESIGVKIPQVTGLDKSEWAEKISPHLNLETPPSPSLRNLIAGVNNELNGSNV